LLLRFSRGAGAGDCAGAVVQRYKKVCKGVQRCRGAVVQRC